MASRVLEPGVQSFIDDLAKSNPPPLYTLSPQGARDVLRQAQRGVTGQPVDLEDRMIPGGPISDVSVRIYRPKGSKDVLPAVVYIHGGGWILGDKDTHDRLMRELANGVNAAMVFVNYTPSPEAQFPTAIEQAYAVARWVAEHGAEARLDPKRLAIAGDSVGGNMAAAVTLMARQRGGPEFVFQLLYYPVTDSKFDTGSYDKYAEGPWLTKEAMKWFWNAYLPDERARENILASPLRASIDELRGLPPALLIVDENDVLRDEGEAYARKLEQAGVPILAERYLGTIHDFVMLNGIAQTNATRGAIKQGVQALRDALYKH